MSDKFRQVMETPECKGSVDLQKALETEKRAVQVRLEVAGAGQVLVAKVLEEMDNRNIPQRVETRYFESGRTEVDCDRFVGLGSRKGHCLMTTCEFDDADVPSLGEGIDDFMEKIEWDEHSGGECKKYHTSDEYK